MKNNNKIFIGEFIGSCFLVMIIVGSGIMAENLTNDNALKLTANTIATGAGLFVLITAFADISGAHFNPFVSLAMYLTKKIKGKLLIIYIPAQIFGCLLGVMLANAFFEHNIIELSTKSRDGFHIFLAEIVATFGLIFIILSTLKDGKTTVAACVATVVLLSFKVDKIINIRPKVATISARNILNPSLLFVDSSIIFCSKNTLASITPNKHPNI